MDVTDLGNLASNYGLGSGATWAQGDSSYDGSISVTDLGDLASNYGASLAGGSLAGGEATNAEILAAVAVPEPAGLGLLALGAVQSLLIRRRKNQGTRRMMSKRIM